MNGADLARAAMALVGTRFRLHGRNPACGLDCVGVLDASLKAIGRPAPLAAGYRLRTRDVAALLPDPAACGFAAAQGAMEPGDVVLLSLEGAQHHLMIAAGDGGFVHAHAGLRRVVMGAAPANAVERARWRLVADD